MQVEYKGFNVKRDRKFGNFSVHMIGKGALPNMLQGVFTSFNEVMKVIDGYVLVKNKE